MYLQSRKEAKAVKVNNDVEQSTKPEDKSVLADVILQTIPKEAQIGAPIGSPVMNGFRREVPKGAGLKGHEKENGVVNPAFENDDENHESFERKNNEINDGINVKSDVKAGVHNAAFHEEI